MSYDYGHSYGSSSGSARMNKYWIIQKDIHRRVITAKVQQWLGPESTVRSYTKDGEDGYLITTPGEFLTDDQIDDICNASTAMWEQQAYERFGIPSPLLKRPLHQPVVVYRASRPHGPAPGFSPYPPPPPPASPFAPPFAPPPQMGDPRAMRPATPRVSSRRHSGGHSSHHSRHHRSYSAGGSFAQPYGPPGGSSLRWEPNSLQEEDDESYPV